MADDVFARRFAELRETFRAGLPATLAELRRLAARGAHAELRMLAHQLAGRGGTFGAPRVSEAARSVEAAEPAELAAALEALDAAIGDRG